MLSDRPGPGLARALGERLPHAVVVDLTSAPGPALMQSLGFTAEQLADKVRAALDHEPQIERSSN